MSSLVLTDVRRKLLGTLLAADKPLQDKEIAFRCGSRIGGNKKLFIDEGLITGKRVGRSTAFAISGAGRRFCAENDVQPVTGPPCASLPAKTRMALYSLLTAQLASRFSDVKRLTGLELSTGQRRALVADGLITIDEDGAALTDKGWRVCEDELSLPAHPLDPDALRVTHLFLSEMLRIQRAAGRSLVDLFVPPVGHTEPETPTPAKTTGARVIDAYPDLAAEPGDLVGLAELREHLSDVPREELDEVLRALFRDGRVELISEANRKALSQSDRDAAIVLAGGDEKHLYVVED